MKRNGFFHALSVLLFFFAALASAQPSSEPVELWAEATLYRDAWGIPHIQAGNPRAMAFAFGYAQAGDHLEPMLLAYRMATGRAAEILGPAMADSDAFAIQCGHARVADVNLGQADPLTLDLCEGFALGVNAWMADHPDEIPPWAEGARPQDILAFWHLFLTRMAPFDLPGQWRPPRPYESGSAWALAPDRTTEGKAILTINPHEEYEGFFRWYEAHLMLPGLNVYGITLYGIPVIMQGFTPALGWALTPNYSDFADVFEERVEETDFDPDHPDLSNPGVNQGLLLEYMAGARPFHVRTQDGLEERYAPSHIGARGPVFEDGSGRLFSWRIGGYFETGGLRQLFEMAQAPGMDVFQNILLYQQIPCFHILCADREGDIFYLYNTRTGHREMPLAPDGEVPPPPPDWKSPLPMDYEAPAWGIIVPPFALPWITNPESGFLQACGNPPWTAAGDDTTLTAAIPPWLVQDPDSLRSRRVRRLLTAGSLSFRDNQAMLFDILAPGAVEVVPRLLAAVEKHEDFLATTHPDAVTGIDLLREWNYLADPDSEAMTFFHVWWTMAGSLLGPAYPDDAARLSMMMADTPEAENLLLDATADAARLLRNEFQTLDIPWGEAHRLHRGDREAPIAGSSSGQPVFFMDDKRFDNGAWRASGGFAHAMAIRFGDRPEAVCLSPFGASDNPASPHFDDQMDLFLEKRFRRARFEPDEVRRHADTAQGSNVVLLPRGVEGAFSFFTAAPVIASLTCPDNLPAPLPAGLRAFTLPVSASWKDSHTPADLLIELTIPESLCRAENLSRLRIWHHDSDKGWREVPEQKLDPDKRLLTGLNNVPGICLAAGPADCLEAPLKSVVPRPPGYTPPPVEEKADQAADVKAPQKPAEKKKKVFRFEVLSREQEEKVVEEAVPDAADLTGIQTDQPDEKKGGVTWGLPPRQDQEEPQGKGRRIFRMERLDKPEKKTGRKKSRRPMPENLPPTQLFIGGDDDKKKE